ncbi:Dor1-domain-containing protein [Thelephora terrestris]|uniref:Conserved oligomeric Golgi complex subunit 8 n=1 Tax=Thelephora terrestris TaxID=56493 RepID=A0A9P6HDW7_9AGAM|nr:Dor1-domain-containing protein [Thelephora terrestris]
MDADDSEYLSYLTSLHLADLKSEPAKLNSSSAQLTNVLITLCHTSYPTFLSAHQSVNTLSTSLNAFSSSLDALISVLPVVEQKAKGFLEEVKDVQAERKKMKVVVENLGRVEEIVGVGGVVEGCVRSGWYGEAVEVEMRIANLARKLDPDGRGVVWDVKAEVDQRIRSMVGDLLSGLRESGANKLPVLFKTVGFLRKMGVLDEEEIAQAFLSCRLSCLKRSLEDLDVERRTSGTFTPVTPSFQQSSVSGSGERYLKKYVDVWREGVYDLVSQFTTIFLERSAASSETTEFLHSLLTTYTTHLLSVLLGTLEVTLPTVQDPSALNSLLTQLTYCATSFSRIGLDFRWIIGGLFEDAVRAGVTKGFRDARDKFIHTVSSTSPTVLSISTSSTSATATGSSSTNEPSLDAVRLDTTNPPHVPPHILTSHKPTVIYANDLLTTLNGLRLLAPKNLYRELLTELDKSLDEAGAAFVDVITTTPLTISSSSSAYGLQGALSKEEPGEKGKRTRVYLGSLFVNVFVPFIRRALVEGVYGSEGEERENDWKSQLGFVRTWEDWLQSSTPPE